jgi:hypothetical protein
MVVLACAVMVTILVAASPVFAQDGDPSKSGDLTGNFSTIVWFLIPLALVLAVLTMVVLGPKGDPASTVRRSGGVSRALDRGDSAPQPPP